MAICQRISGSLTVRQSPAERIDKFREKGRLDPLDVFGLKQSPFKAFTTRVHWKLLRRGVDVRNREGRSYRGVWLVSGGGDVIAWVLYRMRNISADCASSIIRLERDVRRYSGPPIPGFPGISKPGFVAAYRYAWVASINPIERFEAEPPAEPGSGRQASCQRFCANFGKRQCTPSILENRAHLT